MIKNCKLKFRTVSQFQISGKSSSRNISPIFFKVVPCRPFVFIIKVSADQGTYVYVDNKTLGFALWRFICFNYSIFVQC